MCTSIEENKPAMKNKYKFCKFPVLGFLVGLGFLSSYNIRAQIDPQLSLYRLNPQVINPAHVASLEGSEFNLQHRSQWSGLDGAPKTFAAGLSFKLKSPWGLSTQFFQSQFGPLRASSIAQDLAYRIKLSNRWALNGGIRMSLANINVNFGDVRLINQNDPSFTENIASGTKANLGWGIKLAKSNDGLFLMLGQPRVFNYSFENSNGTLQGPSYFNALLGGRINLSDKVQLSPNTLAQFASNGPLVFDVNLIIHLMHRLDLGMGYRQKQHLGYRFGINLNRMYLAYVYEIPQQGLNYLGSANHEFGLKFLMNKQNR